MLAILVLVVGLVSNASAGLVAHYEFAGDFNDSSDNGLHGSPNGFPSIISDPERGDVLSLNGVGQYVVCGNDPLFDITGAITVAAWIKVNTFDKNFQAIVTKGESAWRLTRDGSNNGLEFACMGLSGNWKVSGSKNVDDAQWHHVAGVYNGSEISLYVDGVLDASLAASGTIATSIRAACIGENMRLPGRAWNGLIDDVRIYDHALSPAEIARLTGKMKTAFTYQGRLLDDNKPADGSYDLELKLYDDPDSGTQQGNTITMGQLDVIDGYFTVALDFADGDPNVFNGDPRWLQIGVRPGELDDPSAYTVLSPRQAVTPTPYALLALNGGDGHSLDAADGDPVDAVYVDNEGNVGIGTTSPGEKLEVAGTAMVSGNSTYNLLAVYNYGSGEGVWSYSEDGIGVEGQSQNSHGVYGFAGGGSDKAGVCGVNNYGYGVLGESLFSYAGYFDGKGYFSGNVGIGTTNPGTAKLAVMGGNVGIGTTTPSEKLEVAGAIVSTGTGGAPSIHLNNTAADEWRITSYNDNKLLFWNGANRMAIDQSGNVGIGTTSPGAKLEISDSPDITMLAGTGNPGAGRVSVRGTGDSISNTWDSTVKIKAARSSDRGLTVLTHDESGKAILGDVGGASGWFSGGDLRVSSANLIVDGGNVGIGTTSPSQALEVEGDNPRILVDAASSNPELNLHASGKTTWSMYQDANTGDLRFFQAGDKITFQNGTGNVGIGTTDPSGTFHVAGPVNPCYILESTGTGYEGKWKILTDTTGTFKIQDATSGYSHFVIGQEHGNVGIGGVLSAYKFTVGGDIAYYGDIYDISDIRLKENIAPLENAVEKVSSIRGIYFNNKGESQDEREVGVIAQEVETVLPEAVSEDEKGYKWVGYSKLTPLLIEAVKELKAENEQLKKQLKSQNKLLTQRLEALETKIQRNDVSSDKEVQL